MDYDLVVIGGGSAGVRLARTSAALGARVALIESGRLGGTCVNIGCVPKKLLAYASRFGTNLEDAAGFGFEPVTPRFSWPQLIAGKDREIARLNAVYERIVTNAGATVLRGRASVVGPHEVDLDGQRLSATRIAICTGGKPIVPPIEGAELGVVSDAMFSLPELPRRAVVVGGGYIGVEFASILNGLGVDVALVSRTLPLLRGFDDDARTHLQTTLERRGIRIHGKRVPHSISRGPDGLVVDLAHEDGPLVADLVLFAVGRRPNTDGLGLEAAGVALRHDGGIAVDTTYQTSVPSIYALGDVTHRLQLTPVALGEATALARHLYAGEPIRFGYDAVPTAVFSDPELATVGLSEADARATFPNVKVFRSAFRPMIHILPGRDEQALVKLVVDGDTDRVLGVHIVAPDAAEILQGFAVAVRMGATKADLDRTIGIHPTVAEELVTLR